MKEMDEPYDVIVQRSLEKDRKDLAEAKRKAKIKILGHAAATMKRYIAHLRDGVPDGTCRKLLAILKKQLALADVVG